MAKRMRSARLLKQRTFPKFSPKAVRKDIKAVHKLLVAIGARVQDELDRLQQVEDKFYDDVDHGRTPAIAAGPRHHGRRDTLPQAFYDMQNAVEELVDNFDQVGDVLDVATDNLYETVHQIKKFEAVGKPAARKPRRVAIRKIRRSLR